MFKEISFEEAVNILSTLLMSEKKKSEEIIHRVKNDILEKKLTRKQEERIEEEHTAFLMLRTTEICKEILDRDICRKILNGLYEKIYSFHYDRIEEMRIFKLGSKKKEAIEFKKMLREMMKDYHRIIRMKESEWPRKLVGHLNRKIFKKLGFSKALTLSVGFVSSSHKYEERLIDAISKWRIKE